MSTLQTSKHNNSYPFAFGALIVLFFMWGFITELDGALIPYLKGLFQLNNFQASLVQFAFFIAFFFVSIPSAWLLNKVGYRKGIVVGLLTMALGSFLFYPASTMLYYPVFLGAIFVLAAGVTILQVAANPYVARLGDSKGASMRLNLAQGFNSVAKVLAPIFGSYFILRGLEGLEGLDRAAAVQVPYLILGGALLVLAIIFAFIDLPEVITSENNSNEKATKGWRFLQFPQLSKGTVAIFMYVGAEVTIATFLVILLSERIFPSIASFQAMTVDITNEADKVDKYREIAALYLPYYWGGLMVGRLLGSYILLYVSPNKLLAISAGVCMVLVSAFLASSGMLAMYLIIATGLFLSIMWSNIFTLAIEGLGDYTSRGSGLLVMAIVGGAFIPPLQGYLADMPAIGIQASFAITLVCFAYILYYALVGYKPADLNN